MRWLPLLLVALLVLLYLRSPIDLIPDVFGVFGILDDLGVMALAYWWLRRHFRQTAAGTSRPAGDTAGERAAPPWDPYAVLGVGRGASGAEITRAYRERLKRYHPDRVADLGEELQRLAHEKVLEIQKAYGEIGPRKR